MLLVGHGDSLEDGQFMFVVLSRDPDDVDVGESTLGQVFLDIDLVISHLNESVRVLAECPFSWLTWTFVPGRKVPCGAFEVEVMADRGKQRQCWDEGGQRLACGRGR